MSVIAEYLRLQADYEKKYGPKTVVLMQMGSFYEIYGYTPPSGQPGKVGVAVEVSQLLNMVLTSKDTSKPHSLDNPNLVGFPTASLDRHRDTLLAHGYTLVMITQSGSGKNVSRSLKEVISPATNMEAVGTRQLICIYIEVQRQHRHLDAFLLTSGVTCLDTTTGRNLIVEHHSREEDPLEALHGIYRFMVAQAPQEILVHVVGNVQPEYMEFISQTLELNRYNLVLTRLNAVPADYAKLPYQQQFLGKIFGSPGLLQERVIESLNLERYTYGRISYLLLLQYVYDHNELLIQKLSKPETTWLNADTHLILTYNAILQLDVSIPGATDAALAGRPKECASLFHLVNETLTPMGERLLRSLLLNPLNQVATIEPYYRRTEELLQNETLRGTVGTHLKKLPDIDRLHRKLSLHIIKPAELVSLLQGYVQSVALISAAMTTQELKTILPSETDLVQFNYLLQATWTQLDFDKLRVCKLTEDELEVPQAYIRPGQDPTVDALHAKIHADYARLEAIRDHLCGFLKGGKGVRLEKTLEGHLQLMTTPHRASLLRKSDVQMDLCGALVYQEIKKAETVITSQLIMTTATNWRQNQTQLETYLFEHYKKLIQYMTQHFTFYSPLGKFLAQLDYAHCNAVLSLKYKYQRPQLLTADQSSVHVKALRHPLVERLIRSPYVPNDITLGGTGPTGLLLYGINAAGKSVLTKAVGLSVIMAQAGLYVPGEMKLAPYHKLITRLSGNDDIFRGASSFQIEMEELRTILRQADANTLVLGDELCRGTESVSAVSLCLATYLTLLERQTNFIFATHLHGIATDPAVMALPAGKLRIAHLATSYEEATDTLIYNRQLQEGPGSSVYGLMVAQALHLDTAFIRQAQAIRHRLTEGGTELLTTKRSRYNGGVYMDACQLCGQKAVGQPLQTHHIREQQEADERGFIDHWHKNTGFNLMVLCQPCHTKLHQQNQQVVLEPTLQGNRIKVT